jgi:integrase
MNTETNNKSVTVMEGLLLMRRKGTTAWQARYKSSDRVWRRTSTGESDLDAAKRVAIKIFYDAQARIDNKLPVASRRFSAVANAVINEMDEAVAAGQGKKTFTDYKQVINKYLIPFFGRYEIANIDAPLVAKFEEWRTKQVGRELKASTITNHNSALNRVFDYAQDRGWITQAARVTLKNKGSKSEARPYFTDDEYKQICAKIIHWVKKGRNEKSRQMRELLRDYILVLANTGIRHGTEAQNLKWKDIDWYKQRGKRYLRLTVHGKTVKHTTIARHGTENYLQRIQKRFPELANMSFDDLLKARVDEYVFRLESGERTNNLHQTFEVFLNDIGLSHDATSEMRRTLYSFRHTYATFQLLEGRGIHELAKQMGTSVPMLEKHYSHIQPEMLAEEFAGEKKKYMIEDAEKKTAEVAAKKIAKKTVTNPIKSKSKVERLIVT